MNVQISLPSYLQCTICFNGYETLTREPIVVQCGHTFCRECLVEYFNRKRERNKKVECPLCNKVVLKRMDVGLLPKNYAVLDALAKYEEERVANLTDSFVRTPDDDALGELEIDELTALKANIESKLRSKHKLICERKSKLQADMQVALLDSTQCEAEVRAMQQRIRANALVNNVFASLGQVGVIDPMMVVNTLHLLLDQSLAVGTENDNQIVELRQVSSEDFMKIRP